MQMKQFCFRVAMVAMTISLVFSSITEAGAPGSNSLDLITPECSDFDVVNECDNFWGTINVPRPSAGGQLTPITVYTCRKPGEAPLYDIACFSDDPEEKLSYGDHYLKVGADSRGAQYLFIWGPTTWGFYDFMTGEIVEDYSPCILMHAGVCPLVPGGNMAMPGYSEGNKFVIPPAVAVLKCPPKRPSAEEDAVLCYLNNYEPVTFDSSLYDSLHISSHDLIGHNSEGTYEYDIEEKKFVRTGPPPSEPSPAPSTPTAIATSMPPSAMPAMDGQTDCQSAGTVDGIEMWHCRNGSGQSDDSFWCDNDPGTKLSFNDVKPLTGTGCLRMIQPMPPSDDDYELVAEIGLGQSDTAFWLKSKLNPQVRWKFLFDLQTACPGDPRGSVGFEDYSPRSLE